MVLQLQQLLLLRLRGVYTPEQASIIVVKELQAVINIIKQKHKNIYKDIKDKLAAALPSIGSLLHRQGICKPCVRFYFYLFIYLFIFILIRS